MIQNSHTFEHDANILLFNQMSNAFTLCNFSFLKILDSNRSIIIICSLYMYTN